MTTATTTRPRWERASRQQQKLYRYLCKELALDEDSRRAITKRVCDRWSTKNLTKPQMARLIGELYRLLGQEIRNDYIDTVPGGATVAQGKKIKMLEAALGWTTNPKRLSGFLRRMTCRGLGVVGADGLRTPRDLADGKRSCDDLTKKEASDIIEALKDWIERERGRTRDVGCEMRGDGSTSGES